MFYVAPDAAGVSMDDIIPKQPEPTRSIDDVARAQFDKAARAKAALATLPPGTRPQVIEAIRQEIDKAISVEQPKGNWTNWAPTTKWALSTLNKAVNPFAAGRDEEERARAEANSKVPWPQKIMNNLGYAAGKTAETGMAAASMVPIPTPVGPMPGAAAYDAFLVPYRGVQAGYEQMIEGPNSPTNWLQKYQSLLANNSQAQALDIARREKFAPRWVQEQQAAGIPQQTIEDSTYKQMLAGEGMAVDLAGAIPEAMIGHYFAPAQVAQRKAAALATKEAAAREAAARMEAQTLAQRQEITDMARPVVEEQNMIQQQAARDAQIRARARAEREMMDLRDPIERDTGEPWSAIGPDKIDQAAPQLLGADDLSGMEQIAPEPGPARSLTGRPGNIRTTMFDALRSFVKGDAGAEAWLEHNLALLSDKAVSNMSKKSPEELRNIVRRMSVDRTALPEDSFAQWLNREGGPMERPVFGEVPPEQGRQFRASPGAQGIFPFLADAEGGGPASMVTPRDWQGSTPEPVQPPVKGVPVGGYPRMKEGVQPQPKMDPAWWGTAGTKGGRPSGKTLMSRWIKTGTDLEPQTPMTPPVNKNTPPSQLAEHGKEVGASNTGFRIFLNKNKNKPYTLLGPSGKVLGTFRKIEEAKNKIYGAARTAEDRAKVIVHKSVGVGAETVPNATEISRQAKNLPSNIMPYKAFMHAVNVLDLPMLQKRELVQMLAERRYDELREAIFKEGPGFNETPGSGRIAAEAERKLQELVNRTHAVDDRLKAGAATKMDAVLAKLTPEQRNQLATLSDKEIYDIADQYGLLGEQVVGSEKATGIKALAKRAKRQKDVQTIVDMRKQPGDSDAIIDKFGASAEPTQIGGALGEGIARTELSEAEQKAKILAEFGLSTTPESTPPAASIAPTEPSKPVKWAAKGKTTGEPIPGGSTLVDKTVRILEERIKQAKAAGRPKAEIMALTSRLIDEQERLGKIRRGVADATGDTRPKEGAGGLTPEEMQAREQADIKAAEDWNKTDQAKAIAKKRGMKLSANPFPEFHFSTEKVQEWKDVVKGAMRNVMREAADEGTSVKGLLDRHITDPAQKQAALEAIPEDVVRAVDNKVSGKVRGLNTATTRDPERFGVGAEPVIREALNSADPKGVLAKKMPQTLEEIAQMARDNGNKELAKQILSTPAGTDAAELLRVGTDMITRVKALQDIDFITNPTAGINAARKALNEGLADASGAFQKKLSQSALTMRVSQDIKELASLQADKTLAKWKDQIQNIADPKTKKEFLSWIEELRGQMVDPRYAPTIENLVYHFWRNSIVSGIMTHTMNLGSAIVNVGVKPLFRAGEAAIDAVGSAITGAPRTYYMSEVPAQYKAVWDYFKNKKRMTPDYAELGKHPDRTTSPYAWKAELAGTEAARKAWQKADAIISTPDRSMQYIDQITKGVIGLMEEEGANVRRKGGPLTQPDIQLIHEEQLKRSFQEDLGRWANWLFILRNQIPGARYIQPFIQTVGSIIQQGFEMTPGMQALNMASKSLPTTLKRQKYGVGSRAFAKTDMNTIARREFNSDATKLMAGTALLMWSYDQWAKGNLVGQLPVDAEKRGAKESMGQRPFTYKVGGRYVPMLGIVEPFGTAVMANVAMFDSWKESEKKPHKDAYDRYSSALQSLVTNTGQAIVSKPFLGGLSAAIGGGNMSGGGTAMETALEEGAVARKIAGGFVPAVLKDVSNIIDPIRRQGGTIKTDMQKRTPMKSSLPPALDVYGNPIHQGFWEKENTSPEYQMLKHLTVPIVPKRIGGRELSKEERNTLTQKIGPIAQNVMKKLASNQRFLAMKPTMQQYIVDEVLNKMMNAVLKPTAIRQKMADPVFANRTTRAATGATFPKNVDYLTDGETFPYLPTLSE